MEQKRNLDVDGFYKRMEHLRSSNADSAIFGFVVEYDGDAVSCWLMAHDVIFKQIVVDTFVLDKAWRSETNTPFFTRVCADTCEQVARLLGVKKISYVTPIPEVFLKQLDDKRMKIIEWVVSWEIED